MDNIETLRMKQALLTSKISVYNEEAVSSLYTKVKLRTHKSNGFIILFHESVEYRLSLSGRENLS